MADWTRTNKACSTLWLTLFNMQQLSTNFETSGDIKMNDLTFFNELDSSELRQQQAAVVADQLDNIFRTGRGATYEAGFDRTKAMTGMISILTDAGKTVSDLAANVDGSYLFWQEIK
jgi:hypothetical protein